MRGILHVEDFSWSVAPRGKGGGGQTSTSTQNNAPPPEYLAAYSDAMRRAQGAADQPLQQYPGTPDSLIAGFSPDQLAAMNIVEGSQGIQDPYINAAAQYMSNATAPLKTDDFMSYLRAATGSGVTDASQQGAQGIRDATQSGVAGINAAGQQVYGAGQQGMQGINWAGMQGMAGIGGAGAFGVGNILDASQSFQPGQIGQWMSPYTQNVVDQTQNQFNNQNSQAQNTLRGNAASQGALGGDRLGVGQGILANQQQLAQAPVIANLYQQGYTQAEQAALQQAQMRASGAQAAGQLGLGAATSAGQLGLGAATSAGQLGLGAAQGAGQLAQGAGQLGVQGAQGAGAMGLQGATTNAQLQANAAQQIQAANQAQAWLNSQAGAGMAGLGNQAWNSTLSGANALMGIGGMQQGMAQQYLNIPYEQFLAQQAYPFQTTGWLANLAEGLGSQAGGTSTGTSTSPGPSALSQVAGAGMAGAGLLGASGAFGSNGWLTGGPQDISSQITQGLGAENTVQPSDWATAAEARGGRVTSRAIGGGIPHRAIGGDMSPDPTAGMRAIAPPAGLPDVPDVSMSIVPQGANPRAGPMNLLKDYGKTSTTHSSGGGGDSIFGTVVKGAATVLASIYGTPAAGAAVGALGSQIHFDRGGRLKKGLADGGVPSVSMQPGASGVDVPQLIRTSRQIGGDGGISPAPAPAPAPSSSSDSGGKASGGSFNDYLNASLGKIPSAADLAALAPKPITSQPVAQAKGMIPIGPNAWWSNPYLPQNQPGFADGGGTPGPAASPQAAVPVVTLKDPSFAGGVKVPYISRTAMDTGGGGVSSGGFGDYLAGVRGKTPTQAQIDAGKPKPPEAPATPTLVVDPNAGAWWMNQSGGGAEGSSGGGDGVGGSPGGTGSNDVGMGGGDYGGSGGEVGANAQGGRIGGRRAFAGGGGTGDTGDVGDAPTDALAIYSTDSMPASQIFGPTAAKPIVPGGSVDQPDTSFNSAVDSINNAVPQGPAAAPATHGAGPPPRRGPPALPPPPEHAPPSQPPVGGTDSYGQAIDELNKIKGRDKPDLWMTLLQAGLGTMAGKSPFPMVNIGAGGLGALKQYQSTDKDAQDLAVRVQEAKAKLAETSAYHQELLNTRNRGQDIQRDKFDQAYQIAMLHAINRAGSGGGGGADRESIVPGVTSPNGTLYVIDRHGNIKDTGIQAGPSANTSANVDQRDRALAQARELAAAKADAMTQRGDSAEFNRNLRSVLMNHPELAPEDARSQATILSQPKPTGGSAPTNDPLGIRVQ